MEVYTYSYNIAGQLIEELGQDSWGTGSMKNSYRITYQYNTNGSINTTDQEFWDGANWTPADSEWFFYDSNGN